MAIKTSKKSLSGKVIYKSKNKILTAEEKKQADIEYSELEVMIKNVVKVLCNKGLLGGNAKKNDALVVWYMIGKELDKFLNTKRMNTDDENVFWETLYDRWPKVRVGLPILKIDSTRKIPRHNDFKTARELASFNLDKLKKVGSWGLWREIISYKRIYNDPRIIEWIIKELTTKPRTRDESRPLLKAISNRFKKVDTTILTQEELNSKLAEIKIIEEKNGNQLQKN